MKILEANVIGKRIPFNNGTSWEVNGASYQYGWVCVKTVCDKLADVLHSPVGFEIMGDIMEIQRNETTPDGKSVVYHNVTVFQPHNGIVTEAQSATWDKAHWIECFGSDEHYYGDVESITYKDPKTEKTLTHNVYSISIGANGYFVIIYRKNGKRPTTLIPIANVISKNLKSY